MLCIDRVELKVIFEGGGYWVEIKFDDWRSYYFIQSTQDLINTLQHFRLFEEYSSYSSHIEQPRIYLAYLKNNRVFWLKVHILWGILKITKLIYFWP